MAWSWSHTDDAYAAVEHQLTDRSEAANDGDIEVSEWLEVVWSEWVASDWREDRVTTDLDLKKYERSVTRAKRQGKELGYEKLTADIWNWSSELRTCTNGGWEAWVCPFGCHSIPFTEQTSSD